MPAALNKQFKFEGKLQYVSKVNTLIYTFNFEAKIPNDSKLVIFKRNLTKFLGSFLAHTLLRQFKFEGKIQNSSKVVASTRN